METRQVRTGRSSEGRELAYYDVKPGTVCTPSDDIVVMDDPNYRMTSISDIYVENQGTQIVQVKHHTLLPGDTLRIPCPTQFVLSYRLTIRFLGEYTFLRAIATYPQLWQGKRLLIAYIPYPEV